MEWVKLKRLKELNNGISNKDMDYLFDGSWRKMESLKNEDYLGSEYSYKIKRNSGSQWWYIKESWVKDVRGLKKKYPIKDYDGNGNNKRITIEKKIKGPNIGIGMVIVLLTMICLWGKKIL